MWFLEEGGHVAEKKDDGKVLVRIISDGRGIRYHQYDENFKLIASGISHSVKSAMEKFN